MHHRSQHIALRVDCDVPLAPFDLLACIVATPPPFKAVLADCESRIATVGVGLRPPALRPTPHESKLVGETLTGSFFDGLAARLIGDKADDSDPLDRNLEEQYGIKIIAPNRENCSQTQDGRTLRRYKRRWIVD